MCNQKKRHISIYQYTYVHTYTYTAGKGPFAGQGKRLQEKLNQSTILILDFQTPEL